MCCVISHRQFCQIGSVVLTSDVLCLSGLSSEIWMGK